MHFGLLVVFNLTTANKACEVTMAQRLALRGLGGAQSQGSSLAKSANLSRNVVSIQERRLGETPLTKFPQTTALLYYQYIMSHVLDSSWHVL